MIRIHAWPEAEVRVITNKQSAELEGSCVPRMIAAGVPIQSRNTLHPAVHERSVVSLEKWWSIALTVFLYVSLLQLCIIDGKTVIQGALVSGVAIVK